MESFTNANIILDNGAFINLKSASVLNTLVPGVYVDISGEKAGARKAIEF